MARACLAIDATPVLPLARLTEPLPLTLGVACKGLAGLHLKRRLAAERHAMESPLATTVSRREFHSRCAAEFSTAIRDQAKQLLAEVPGGVTPGRMEKLTSLLESHHNRDVVLEVCGDEYTGERYGLAKCRQSPDGERLARKIGRSTFKYQVWATWTSLP